MLDNTSSSAPAPARARLGLASLIASLIGALLFCGVSAAAFLAGFTGHEDIFRGTSSVNIISGLVMYGGGFLGLIGVILGIISLTQKEKKTLGILGLVLGILIICSCAVLTLIGVGAQFTG